MATALRAGGPGAFRAIFVSAFTPDAAFGGAVGTASAAAVITAMRTGIARGVYTNEAGLGVRRSLLRRQRQNPVYVRD